jgi:23S rRNA (cytosine1962-C5)-methyltransferase
MPVNWAQRNQYEAYRIYDRDIPEFPFIVDVYNEIYVVYDRSDKWIDREKNHMPQVLQALQELFKIDETKIIVKKRERQEGNSQYEKIAETGHRFKVKEGASYFWVNPYDYLDTGLFLDHRPLRQKMAKITASSADKGSKAFLNLFCYTGTFSVVAAQAGAKTTSVDMSKTYIEWAQDNFKLNQISLNEHHFIQTDAIDYLRSQATQSGAQKFDVIYLDPPTFSNSKRMAENFEVERDQLDLISHTMALLNADGELYFSTNKRNFKLLPEITARYSVEDITGLTIPNDFHDKKIHQAYLLRNKHQ